MHTLRPALLLLPLLLIVLVAPGCRKEELFTDEQGVTLEFSRDSILFDTIFTTVGSITKRFTARNPGNRDHLLSLDPEVFIETMTRWATAFIPDSRSPVPGMTIDDYARLEMPVMIVDGAASDIWHPAYVSKRVHELIPHSRLVAAPWPDEAPLQRIGETAQTGIAPFGDWHQLAPLILDFTGA